MKAKLLGISVPLALVLLAAAGCGPSAPTASPQEAAQMQDKAKAGAGDMSQHRPSARPSPRMMMPQMPGGTAPR